MVAFSRMSVEALREYNAAAQRRSRARTTCNPDAEPKRKREPAPSDMADGPILTAGNNASARPSEQLMADARRRRAASMSLTAELMGDPPPGQSALDKRMST